MRNQQENYHFDRSGEMVDKIHFDLKSTSILMSKTPPGPARFALVSLYNALELAYDLAIDVEKHFMPHMRPEEMRDEDND